MPKLKIQTGSGTVVPGQETAEQQRAEQQAQAEYDSNLLYRPGLSSQQDVGPDYTYSRIRLRKKDEVNVYAAEQDKRYGMDRRARILIIMGVVCAVVFFLACVLPTQVFDVSRAHMSLAIYLSETMRDVQEFIKMFANPDSMYTTYVLTLLVSLLAGAAMALSGGIFQGTLKNALASPSTLGVTSGASIGAIIYTVFVYPNSQTVLYTGSSSDLAEIFNNMSLPQLILEEYGGFVSSLIGCCAVVTIVMSISLIAGRGKVSNVALIIAGQVLTQFINLVLSFIRMWLENHGDAEAATYLAQNQSATFTGAYTPTSVLVFVIPLLICMGVCFAMSSRMSLLAFNDDEARSMGISTTRMRNFMVAICTIMTALVVSFCGAVGFVGLIVPYIARRLVGPDFRYLLPACTLVGAIMVPLVYYICEMGIPGLASTSTGTLTSIIGSVFFLVILLRGRRSSGGEWL